MVWIKIVTSGVRPRLIKSTLHRAPSLRHQSLAALASPIQRRFAPRNTLNSTMTARSGKRSASTSPVKDSRPKKAAHRSIAEEEEELLLNDDLAFDSDALHEATKAAEVEDAQKQNSSQPSAAGSKSSVSSQSSQKTASLSVFSPPSGGTQQFKHGDDRVESETMDKEWYARLQGEMEKAYFRSLKAYLQREANAGKTIYPPAHLVHSWSRLTPLSTVKVVVVGQDPYHGAGQACGHSFSVPKGVSVPGSLQNIYKELKQEYGAAFAAPKHGCLDEWAKQGVLLLNACLTVSAGQAGSHHNQGWEPFTQTILRTIAQDAANGPKASIKSSTIASMFGKQRKTDKPEETKTKIDSSSSSSSLKAAAASKSKGVVFLAWGLPAAKTLAAAGITENSSNVLLLKSAHPSPLSAHRGFLGNGHFKKANEWLENEARYGPGGGIEWAKL